jgi:serine/threonine-protein kinase
VSAARKICPQCSTEYDVDQRFCPRDGASLRAANAAADLVGEVVADRYLITQKLGEGGMGQVYLAEHVRMGRKSAVKVMNPSMVHDADAISRFNREASNASRISHPNVAAIYDFGETAEGLIYLAMEYVDGEPLTRLIARERALSPARAAEIVRQTGDALAVAHELGIVHRDLKPDNIMITRGRDGGDFVKVVDFGIAKAGGGDAQQKVTKTGLVVGTPEFMSPEQLAGDPLDGRSDVYSLGLVAFNMMTGALPFPSETAQESMIMRLTDRPRTLAETRGDLAWPAEVQRVLDRALARDARERYQSAADFGRDIVRAAGSPAGAASTAGGTVVIGSASLPATRVAPVRGSTTANKPTVAVRPARRRAPLVAAAVAISVLGLAAAAFASRVLSTERAPSETNTVAAKPSFTSGDSLSKQVAADDTSADTSAAAERSPSVPPRTDVAGTEPAAGATFAPAVAVSSSRPSAPRVASFAPDVATQLAQIDSLAASPETAPRALRLIAALLPRLRTGRDSVHALYRRGEAQLGLDDKAGGCETLAEVRRMPPTKNYTVGANSLYTLAGCDP